MITKILNQLFQKSDFKENNVEVQETTNLEIVRGDDYLIVYDKKGKRLSVHSDVELLINANNGMKLNVKGDFDLTVDGEINIKATRDAALDAENFFMCSNVSKQSIAEYWALKEMERLQKDNTMIKRSGQ